MAIKKSKRIQKNTRWDEISRFLSELFGNPRPPENVDARSSLYMGGQIPYVEDNLKLKGYPGNMQPWLHDNNPRLSYQPVLSDIESQIIPSGDIANPYLRTQIQNIANYLGREYTKGNLVPNILNTINAPQRAADMLLRQYYRTPRALEPATSLEIAENPALRNLYNRPGYAANRNTRPLIPTNNNALSDAQFALQYLLLDPRSAWARNALGLTAIGGLANSLNSLNQNQPKTQQTYIPTEYQTSQNFEPSAMSVVQGSPVAIQSNKKPKDKIKQIPVKYQTSEQNPTSYREYLENKDNLNNLLFGSLDPTKIGDAQYVVLDKLLLDYVNRAANDILYRANEGYIPQNVAGQLIVNMAKKYADTIRPSMQKPKSEGNTLINQEDIRNATNAYRYEKINAWADARANEFMEQYMPNKYARLNSPEAQQIKKDMREQFRQYAISQFSVENRIKDFTNVLAAPASDEKYGVMARKYKEVENILQNEIDNVFNANKQNKELYPYTENTYNVNPINYEPSLMNIIPAYISGLFQQDKSSPGKDSKGRSVGFKFNPEEYAYTGVDKNKKPISSTSSDLRWKSTPLTETYGRNYIPAGVMDELWRKTTQAQSYLAPRPKTFDDFKNKVQEVIATLDTENPSDLLIQNAANNVFNVKKSLPKKLQNQSGNTIIQKSLSPKYQSITKNKYLKEK